MRREDFRVSSGECHDHMDEQRELLSSAFLSSDLASREGQQPCVPRPCSDIRCHDSMRHTIYGQTKALQPCVAAVFADPLGGWHHSRWRQPMLFRDESEN